MLYRITTSILAIILVFRATVYGQEEVTLNTSSRASLQSVHQWDDIKWRVGSHQKIQVVTIADPTHRSVCRLASLTHDQLACKGPFGATRIYKTQEITALILPGDYNQKFPFLIGLNTAAGFATWGTVVLVATCIPCAAATAFAALLFLGAAGAVLIADDQPDTLIYLASGQHLQVKGYVSQGE